MIALVVRQVGMLLSQTLLIVIIRRLGEIDSVRALQFLQRDFFVPFSAQNKHVHVLAFCVSACVLPFLVLIFHQKRGGIGLVPWQQLAGCGRSLRGPWFIVVPHIPVSFALVVFQNARSQSDIEAARCFEIDSRSCHGCCGHGW